MISKNILFFGDSEDLIENIQTFCTVIENAKLYCFTNNVDCILEKSASIKSNIIFIDFTKMNKNQMISLCQVIHFLKTKSIYKSVLFVAILSSDGDKGLNDLMITSGFQYIFIKGSDTGIFLTDICYIAFENEIAMPSFARAKRINLDLNIQSVSSLHEIDLENIVIETDIALPEGDQARVTFNLFGENNTYSMEVIEKSEVKNRFHYDYSYRLALPIEQPWEEPEADTLQKVVIESWIENHMDQFEHVAHKVLLFSEDPILVNGLYDKFSSYLIIENETEEQIIYENIQRLRPAIIFISLKKSVKDKSSPDLLDIIFEAIKSIGGAYLPIIFVANSPSTTQALSKAFNYQSILAIEDDLSASLLSNLVQKYLESKKINNHEPKFKFEDLTRIAAINTEVIVTSLTEHDITFISDVEFPMFSCLKLELPIESYLTIIPPYIELSQVPDKYHYQAFVHGMSQKNQDRFRSLIYQICHRPLKDFSLESINSALKRDFYYNENFVNKAESVKENVVNEIKHKLHNEDTIYKRPPTSGRTKL